MEPTKRKPGASESELRRYMVDRTLLRFAQAVETEFRFLGDYGFTEIASTPTLVRYVAGTRFVTVYHDERSCELGVEFGLTGQESETKYSLNSLIHLDDPEEDLTSRDRIAMTPEEVGEGVRQLAAQLREHGVSVLRGDPDALAALENRRRQTLERLMREQAAAQARPRAEEAFRARRYSEAAQLYESISSSLSPAELKKLTYAKSRASR